MDWGFIQGLALFALPVVLKVLGVLEDQFKDILKTSKAIADSSPLDSYKGIKDTEKAIKNTTDAVEGLDKIERKRKKLQEDLKALEDERIKNIQELKLAIQNKNKEVQKEVLQTSELAKQNARLKVEIQQQNRINKLNAVQASKLSTEYEKQSATPRLFAGVRKRGSSFCILFTGSEAAASAVVCKWG